MIVKMVVHYSLKLHKQLILVDSYYNWRLILIIMFAVAIEKRYEPISMSSILSFAFSDELNHNYRVQDLAYLFVELS